MTLPASSQALIQYLARLPATPSADASLWRDEAGRVHGRYVQSTLTSAFQPIRRAGTGQIVGVQGLARSYSRSDDGLSLWKLLDQVATDDQSIELDRLCRLLHAVNFYRQPELEQHDLYLSVHARLLAAVDADHGRSFRRVLDLLELPHQQIVLQLPPVVKDQRWLLNYVADNYRRNGFRLAINAVDARQALDDLQKVQPDAIKVEAREITDGPAVVQLLREAGARGIAVIFKRVETEIGLALLQRLGEQAGQEIVAQGFVWDHPAATTAGWSGLSAAA